MSQEFNRLWDKIEHDLGFNNHDMRRDRPYSGQSHTDTGTRGATEINGVTFRDLHDCFIRAFIRSHRYYAEGTIAPIQPNAALIDEARKGEHAVICENDVYRLHGDIDPMAFCQNLSCEIERVMGIYPNVPSLEVKDSQNDRT